MSELDFNINDIIKELEADPEYINTLTDEQVLAIEKKMNPYNSTIFGPSKYTCIGFTNLREKYMTKLLTTGLVGFLFQMKNEHKCEEISISEEEKIKFIKSYPHPDKNNEEIRKALLNRFEAESKYEFLKNVKNMEEAEINKIDLLTFEFDLDDLIQINKTTQDKLDEELKDEIKFDADSFAEYKNKITEKETAKEKEIIEKFLNNLFEYNPNKHAVQSVNKDDINSDPERKELLKSNNVSNKTLLQKQPPNDTFSRFQFYYDVNYEELREATLLLYNEKPDIEVAINIFDTFDTIEECETYIDKHKDNVSINILSLTNYKWNLLGSFKENRNRVDFYNKNTKILENILKQQEDDAKTGKTLLNDRIKKQKVKNIKEYGKDHPYFTQYKENNLPADFHAKGVVTMADDDKIVVEETLEVSEHGAPVDEMGIPEDSLEVKVTSIKLSNNEVKTGKIYTKAYKPEEKK